MKAIKKQKIMNKKAIIILSTVLFLVACGGSKTEEAKQNDSTVVDESSPKIEKEIITETDGEETVVADEKKTDDKKTSVMNPVTSQNDPERVMEEIFAAAESGNYTGLDGFCADDADGDCKSICSIATADAKKKAEFKTYFSTGVVTNTEINGSTAKVDFNFGPDGKKSETMKLVLVGGKWYIQSF